MLETGRREEWGIKGKDSLLLIPPLHQQVLSSISLSPGVEVELGPD